jgi:DNA-binding PadR family transcriptional regulator
VVERAGADDDGSDVRLTPSDFNYIVVISQPNTHPVPPMTYLGSFEQLILFSVLQLEGEAYGVSIRENIEERTKRAVSIGAIYTTLGRLEDRGLVRSRAEKPRGRTGRPRKYYALSPEGARDLRESYDTIQSMAGEVTPELDRLAESG